jgi:hypothetical protein
LKHTAQTETNGTGRGWNPRPQQTSDGGVSEEVLYHLQVFNIGDYYGVESLQELAASHLKNALTTRWSVTNFLKIMEEANNSAHRKHLDDAVLALAVPSIEELVALPEFHQLAIKKEWYPDIIRQVLVSKREKQCWEGCQHRSSW